MSHAHNEPHAAAAAHSADAAHSSGHHGHHIVPRRMLLLVLGLLMFFTLLTVGCAQLELWIAHTFDIQIPTWVNVAVALSIATVKSIIVATFFMQLKYDNPVNTLVVVFTIICFAFFIGFSMIDLGNRGALYEYKRAYRNPGGLGNVAVATGKIGDDGKPVYDRPAKGIVLVAREKADKQIESVLNNDTGDFKRDILTKNLQVRLATVVAEAKASGEYDKTLGMKDDKWAKFRAYLARNPEVMDLAHAGHGGGHADDHSSPAQSRPMLTLALPGADAHAHGDHADHGHGDTHGKKDATEPAKAPAGH